MLQLVGENKDKHRASYGVDQGRLVPIMRGVLVEAGDDADAVILNHAILIAPPGSNQFSSVRLAPAYDTVTTRIFPGLEHDAMALTLNGKRNRLNRQDFGRAAAIMDLPRAAASQAVDEVCAALRRHLAAFMTDNPYVIQVRPRSKNDQFLFPPDHLAAA
jgi:serine/threonine-protein kinase HipA